MTDRLNGVYIELTVDEEGVLQFGGGWDFDEDVSDEYVDYMQCLLAGLYGILSTQTENVLAAGDMVRSAPGFDGFEGDMDEGGIQFTPDPALENKIKTKDGNVIDLASLKPKSKSKH